MDWLYALIVEVLAHHDFLTFSKESSRNSYQPYIALYQQGKESYISNVLNRADTIWLFGSIFLALVALGLVCLWLRKQNGFKSYDPFYQTLLYGLSVIVTVAIGLSMFHYVRVNDYVIDNYREQLESDLFATQTENGETKTIYKNDDGITIGYDYDLNDRHLIFVYKKGDAKQNIDYTDLEVTFVTKDGVKVSTDDYSQDDLKSYIDSNSLVSATLTTSVSTDYFVDPYITTFSRYFEYNTSKKAVLELTFQVSSTDSTTSSDGSDSAAITKFKNDVESTDSSSDN